MSVIFFTKEMHDVSVCLFVKAAIKEVGVLPVRHFLGFRALRMSVIDLWKYWLGHWGG